MSIAILIILTILLGLIPTHETVIAHGLTWDVSLYVRDLQCFIWLFVSFLLTSRTKYLSKTTLLIFSFYVLIEAHLQIIDIVYGYGSYKISYIAFSFILIPILVYNISKKYNYKSDTIDDDSYIYFAFWQPKTFITLSASVLGRPFGGMSIYANGILYGYRWGCKCYKSEKIDKKVIEKNFIIKNTRIKNNSIITLELRKLVGKATAGFFRVRCIKSIKPVLASLGDKFVPKGLEHIPSVYAGKVFK